MTFTTHDHTSLVVRRVDVTDPVATARPYDYADAFEVRLNRPDPYPPADWVQAGLEATPKVVERIVGLLGRTKGDHDVDREVRFQVAESTAEVVRLETSLALLDVVIVGRQIEPAVRRLTTMLYFERPVLARLAWTFIGLGHRRFAPRILTSKIADPGRGDEGDFGGAP